LEKNLEKYKPKRMVRGLKKNPLEQERCNFLQREPNKMEDYWLGDISLMQFEKAGFERVDKEKEKC